MYTILSKSLSMLRSLFISGLLMLLPVALTVFIFQVAFELVRACIAPLRYLEPTTLRSVPYIEFALAIALILLVGLILRVFVFKQLVHALERLITRVPLVRPVYSGLKHIIHAFSKQDAESFQQVVFIEFTRPGAYCIGFVTGTLSPNLSPDSSQTYYNIFIPHTPNPTGGFYFIATAKDFKVAKLTVQEAMTLVLSGGIVQPDGKSSH